MVAKKKPKPKVKVRPVKIDPSSHPALENLVERLSSPRLRPQTTIDSYLVTAQNFLNGLGGTKVPTDSDFRRYFIRRRHEDISERTLRKEFFHLQKLTRANKWDWPFESDDIPFPEEEQKLPVMSRESVEQLIKAKGKMTNAERFYLAVATTWIVRREELSRIKKRDFDSESILIHTAKHGRPGKHLIPDELRQVFADYRPKEHSPSALSIMFRRISTKAGIELRPRESWHSIRYSLNTILEEILPRRVLADFSHWKTISNQNSFEENKPKGEDMIERYRRPEVLHSDPYYADKIVYANHPFLPLWKK